jgi:glycerate-2-kinase
MRRNRIRQTAVDIFEAALQAVDPLRLVSAHRQIIMEEYFRNRSQKMFVASFGKAAYAMIQALLDRPVSDLITRGVILTKYGHTPGGLPGKIGVFEAGHPVPDAAGVSATRRLIDMIRDADAQTLVLCLISGGASALLVAPRDNLTLSDKQQTTRLLLNAGADIHEINTVRKHLSEVKGGRLAALAGSSPVLSLILSDVIGDPLDVIASGPTAPDETTFSDALSVVYKYKLDGKIPVEVQRILEEGERGKIAETPKAGDPLFRNVRNIIIGNNQTALEAALRKAETFGFETFLLSSEVRGEAQVVARALAQKAIGLKKTKAEGKKICLISGGETTVTVRGDGLGGRNMEMALAFAREIAGMDGITFLSAGTDGTDGPTDVAGAIVDGQTIGYAQTMGLSASIFLKRNDSYTFFKSTDELLKTGSTGTNVMDIQIILLT